MNNLPSPRRTEGVYQRLTVVESIYLQHPQQQAIAVESKWNRVLTTEEQPYLRRLMVGEEWLPLDTGWLREVSLLSIANEAGLFTQVIPTLEERAEQEAKILEIGIVADEWQQVQDSEWQRVETVKPFWLIPPRESLRGTPVDLRSLYLRCRSGACPVSLNLFPR